VAQLRYEKNVGVVVLRQPGEHVHGLGRRRRFVEQRGARHVEPAQIHHHGLEVEQRLEAALGNFGLVGRVGRVPAGIFQDVALDHRRQDGVGVAHADVGAHAAVAAAEAAQLGQGFVLGQRGRKVERTAGADRLGHGLPDHFVERGGAHHAQHLGQIRWPRADVAKDELVLGCIGHRAAFSPRSL
jgi:hypothetical protein